MNADLKGPLLTAPPYLSGFNANTGLVEGVNFSGTNAPVLSQPSPVPLTSAGLIFSVSPFETLTFPPPPLIPIRVFFSKSIRTLVSEVMSILSGTNAMLTEGNGRSH